MCLTQSEDDLGKKDKTLSRRQAHFIPDEKGFLNLSTSGGLIEARVSNRSSKRKFCFIVLYARPNARTHTLSTRCNDADKAGGRVSTWTRAFCALSLLWMCWRPVDPQRRPWFFPEWNLCVAQKRLLLVTLLNAPYGAQGCCIDPNQRTRAYECRFNAT